MINRSCSKCGNPIFMSETNGKWNAFEDSTMSVFHRCNGVQTPSSTIERVSLLEKIVRKQANQICLLQEQIAELRKEKI